MFYILLDLCSVLLTDSHSMQLSSLVVHIALYFVPCQQHYNITTTVGVYSTLVIGMLCYAALFHSYHPRCNFLSLGKLKHIDCAWTMVCNHCAGYKIMCVENNGGELFFK